MKKQTNFQIVSVAISILIALGLIGIANFLTSGKNEPASQDELKMAAGPTDSLSAEKFSQLIAKPGIVLIDVRTPEEFDSGHIKGAQNIDYYASDFREKIDRLDKTKSYAIYCRTGHRSGMAKEIMKNDGFSEVVDLSGGISAWAAARLALECSPGKVCIN